MPLKSLSFDPYCVAQVPVGWPFPEIPGSQPPTTAWQLGKRGMPRKKLNAWIWGKNECKKVAKQYITFQNSQKLQNLYLNSDPKWPKVMFYSKCLVSLEPKEGKNHFVSCALHRFDSPITKKLPRNTKRIQKIQTQLTFSWLCTWNHSPCGTRLWHVMCSYSDIPAWRWVSIVN